MTKTKSGPEEGKVKKGSEAKRQLDEVQSSLDELISEIPSSKIEIIKQVKDKKKWIDDVYNFPPSKGNDSLRGVDNDVDTELDKHQKKINQKREGSTLRRNKKEVIAPAVKHVTNFIREIRSSIGCKDDNKGMETLVESAQNAQSHMVLRKNRSEQLWVGNKTRDEY